MNSIFQVLTLAWTLQGGQYFNDTSTSNVIPSINQASGSYSDHTIPSYSPFFMDVSMEFKIPISWKKGDENSFFIGIETENQFFPTAKITSFAPWQDLYKFNAGLRIFGMEVGYLHECIHPVLVQDNIETSSFFAGYDKVYIKLSGFF